MAVAVPRAQEGLALAAYRTADAFSRSRPQGGNPVEQGEGCYFPSQPDFKKTACRSQLPIVLYHDYDPASFKATPHVRRHTAARPRLTVRVAWRVVPSLSTPSLPLALAVFTAPPTAQRAAAGTHHAHWLTSRRCDSETAWQTAEDFAIPDVCKTTTVSCAAPDPPGDATSHNRYTGVITHGAKLAGVGMRTVESS